MEVIINGVKYVREKQVKKTDFIIEVKEAYGLIKIVDSDTSHSFWLPEGQGDLWREFLDSLREGQRLRVSLL